MTNRWKTIGIWGGAAVLGLGVYYPLSTARRDSARYEAGNKAVAERKTRAPRMMTPEEMIKTLLPGLESKEASAKRPGLDAIAMALKGGEKLSEETRERTARALIDVYSAEDQDTEEADDMRNSALRILATQLKGPTARDFVAQLMSTGQDEEKLDVLTLLVEPHALRGGDISAKALELAKSDTVPVEMKPSVLRVALGSKADAAIVELMKGDIGQKGLRACAVELQNLGKPELVGPMLARLEEAGLLKDPQSLPWMSGKLLSAHIKTAEGDDLLRALRVVWLRPRLTKQTMKVVSERIAHADPQIRRIVARLVPDAVKYEGIDAGSGEKLLASRLEVETDPGVKGELEGSLAQVRQGLHPQASVPTATTQ